LAIELTKLGYEVEFKRNEGGNYEAHIQGIPQNIITSFSKRSQEIELEFERLCQIYPSRDRKELREEAALKREIKGTESREEIMKLWEKELAELNQTKESIIGSIQQIQNQDKKTILLTKEEIVEKAINTISDRKAIFSKEEVLHESLKMAEAHFNLEEIQNAIVENKSLISINKFKTTTQEIVNAENHILAFADVCKNRCSAILNQNDINHFLNEFRAEGKYELNDGQKSAVSLILNSQDRFIGIQGDAGSAKTSGVVAAVSASLALARSRGKNIEIVGLAPTNLAAKTLEKEGSISSFTIDNFLQKKLPKSDKERVYIVDESSMLGTKKLSKLIQKIENENSRIVLVGDSKQLDAIQAGSMFNKLQEHQLVRFAFLDKSLRQKNIETKAIVEAFKIGNIELGFEKLDSINHLVINEDMSKNAKDIIKTMSMI